jgi:hypothetical protein
MFLNMNIFKITVCLSLSVVILNIFASCASIGSGMQSGAESAINRQNKTIVLFRVYGEMLGDPLEGSEYFIEMANLERDEIPKEYKITYFTSLNGTSKGWAYFVLEPGTYHFTVVPGYRAQDAGPDKINADNGKLTRQIFGKTMDISTFWFRVPNGIPLLYVGSLYYSCNGQKGMSWNVEGCTDIQIIDETGLASLVAQTDFRQYGQMTSLLASRYGELDTKKVQDLMPIGAEVSGQLGSDSPDWVEMSKDRAVLPNYAFFMGGPLGVPFYLPVYPYGVVVWGPCMEIISREFQYFDLVTKISRILSENGLILNLTESTEIDGVSQTAGSNIRSNLYANIQRVALRECNESWTFCVEVEMRARLKDAATGNYVYDAVHQYTFSQKGRPRGRDRYILPVPVSSECRELAEYCSAEGPQILRSELNKAARVLAEKVLMNTRQVELQNNCNKQE